MRNHKFFTTLCSLLLIYSFISCSGNLTEKEQETIEKYTKHEQHDRSLLGKWMKNETFLHQQKAAKIALSFDPEGNMEERMFVEDQPFNDWHLLYYYHTEEGKIYMYRPAEKGVMAMDGEIWLEYEYQISEDGKTLAIGDEVYSSLEE